MSATPTPSHPPTQLGAASLQDDLTGRGGAEDGFAIGWECANPVLQIESWGQQARADEAGGAY